MNYYNVFELKLFVIIMFSVCLFVNCTIYMDYVMCSLHQTLDEINFKSGTQQRVVSELTSGLQVGVVFAVKIKSARFPSPACTTAAAAGARAGAERLSDGGHHVVAVEEVLALDA